MIELLLIFATTYP